MPTSEASPVGLIDIAAAAERLGVSVRYVRRLVAQRRIPYVKLGHYLRFDPTELDAWIDQSRVAAFDLARRPRSA
ncbi:MAG: helix-turn-helix domain-containing protein [Acidimicrobiia bacterium]|nr:helix-turn-helix domain-containing protein [Acidimicrobiia bacterium]